MKPDQIPSIPRRILNFIITVFSISVLAGVVLGPTGSGGFSARQSAARQTAKAIGLSLYAYSIDHNGRYPDGTTSTDVFQHLIDEKYVTDPAVFYLEFMDFPGKVRPEGLILKPENVCWDVTSVVDSSSPGNLPVVFLTGYKVSYQAGARASASSYNPSRQDLGLSGGMA